MAIAFAVMVAKSIAIPNENERLVVFRLGQVLSISPPGLTFLVPFIDRGVKVRVDEIAGWQKLPENELQQRLVQAAMAKSR